MLRPTSPTVSIPTLRRRTFNRATGLGISFHDSQDTLAQQGILFHDSQDPLAQQLTARLALVQPRPRSAAGLRHSPPLRLFKRKALLIAVGYCDGQVWPDSQSPMRLYGPHNDAERWGDYLIQQGWAPKHIRILSDKPGTPACDWPTRSNMAKADFSSASPPVMDYETKINWFVAVAGHRSQLACPFGESDVTGMTKGVVPDYGTAFFPMDIENPIRDYVSLLARVVDVCLLKTLVPGARLTMVIDACDVGVPFRVPWEYTLEANNRLTNIHADPEARLGIGSLIILGACAENQKAREVAFPNGPQYGAMTFYVTELLKRAPDGVMPLARLIPAVNRLLQEGGQQVTNRREYI
ncbi:hypothetical protein M407DRAFT_227202 [Tulasnella calospora MUT 4182]|uniref:Uncharacterized protein n=1 Tax=Tulasnella calospora MUT 4182 TaxID=1051891 RepID=A0A0C3LJ13_9AGAM|nr:hypothetical protein M407DRAFT_227202 [Tulasnella calospora MUT 4182]